MKHMLLCLILGATTFVAAFDTKEVNNSTDAGYSLVLTEDLRFGGDDIDETIWASDNTKILPGPDGQMYIFDVQESRVLVFDKNGEFVRVAASKGNGPGELLAILCVTQAADGSILVMDMNPGMGQAVPRISRYKYDMTFIDRLDAVGMEGIPAMVTVSPDGKYLGGLFASIDMAAQKGTLVTGLMDVEQKKFTSKVHTIPMSFPDPTRINEPAMWEDYLAKNFKMLYSFGMITINDTGQVFSAVSKDYQISKWTIGDKEPNLQFSRDYKPIPFGEKERTAFVDSIWDTIPGGARSLITRPTLEKALVKAELPPRKAPLVALIPLEDKGIIAVHDVNISEGYNLGDVFDNDGKYLCSIKVENYGLFKFTQGNPTPRMVFRDGYAYAIHTDEDDEQYAVRYTYNLGKR